MLVKLNIEKKKMDDIQGGIKHEIIRIDYVAAFDRGIDQYLMSVISES